jgi:hypothetical protein
MSRSYTYVLSSKRLRGVWWDSFDFLIEIAVVVWWCSSNSGGSSNNSSSNISSNNGSSSNSSSSSSSSDNNSSILGHLASSNHSTFQMVILFPSLGEVPKQRHPLGKISIPVD